MNPLLMLLMGLGLAGQGGSLGGQHRIGRRTRDFFRDNSGFADIGDWPDRQHNEEAILAGVTGGGYGSTAQAAGVDWQNQEQSREENLGRAQGVLNQVQTGALGQAEKDVQGLPAQAIDQATFDRMAASMFDANRAGAASQQRQTEDYAARSGGTPHFDYGNQQTVAAQEGERNSAGLRDLLVNQQLANTQYGLQRAGAMADIGGMYNQQFGLASDNVSALNTPTPLAPLGTLADSWRLMELGMMNENDAARSQLLASLGSSLFGAGMGQMQSGAALRASQQQSPWGGGFNPVSAGLGAGIGAIAGGPGGWALGAGLGGLGGAAGNPYAGLFASPQYGLMSPWTTPPSTAPTYRIH